MECLAANQSAHVFILLRFRVNADPLFLRSIDISCFNGNFYADTRMRYVSVSAHSFFSLLLLHLHLPSFSLIQHSCILR